MHSLSLSLSLSTLAYNFSPSSFRLSLPLGSDFFRIPPPPPPLIHFGLPRTVGSSYPPPSSSSIVLPLLHRSDQLQGKQCLISVNAAIMAIVVVASACRAAWRFEECARVSEPERKIDRERERETGIQVKSTPILHPRLARYIGIPVP